MRSTILLGAALLALGLTAETGETYSFGIPTAPTLINTSDETANAWLAQNKALVTAAFLAPVAGSAESGVSNQQAVEQNTVYLSSCEGGFALQRTKPEYWLADRLDVPEGTDITATYAAYQANATEQQSFLFDSQSGAVYATQGGTTQFTWKLTNGTEKTMTYTIGMTCQGRPRRIFWTDFPYNAPGVNLSGKFVRFFGNADILSLQYGTSTNFAGGITQVMTNKVTRGLYLDPASMVLYAAGKITGQVIMAYYDSGTYDVLTAVQVVEVAKPEVIVKPGTIGTALEPDGHGYATEGLTALPTIVSETDDRGPYLYQHTGTYSYSPKHGNVYPLRPTTDCRWNAEIYWLETDVMGVQWPFEVCQYECDWAQDTQLFVRGDVNGDTGRPIYFPSEYTLELCKYQEPEGHALNPATDGTFETQLADGTTEGYSLLKLVADDNIWFLPIHSVKRSDANYYTLREADLNVACEARPRLGADEVGPYFSCDVATDAVGYLYAAASGTHYNPELYQAPTADAVNTESVDIESLVSGTTDATVPSALFPVNVPADASQACLEVWWPTTIQDADMPAPIDVPCLPQRYRATWPETDNAPQIIIASQKGSANEYLCECGVALQFATDKASVTVPSRACFGEEGGTFMFWTRASSHGTGALASFGGGGTNPVIRISTRLANLRLEVGTTLRAQLLNADAGTWTHVAVSWNTTNIVLYVDAEPVAQMALTAEQVARLAEVMEGSVLGAVGAELAQPGRELARISTWRRCFSPAEIADTRYRNCTGAEADLTTYFAFNSADDFIEAYGEMMVADHVFGTEQLAVGVAMGGKGPLGYETGIISSDSTPKVYVQNNAAAIGYNPNEEHAVIRAGSGGYVAWAIRSDLNRDDTSKPAVLVSYEQDGRACMQYFAVALTNSLYPELAAPCTAGLQLPGPHPLDLFDTPWLTETWWEKSAADSCSPGFRDRKGQLWARSAGTLPIHMYYAMQEGFYFPTLKTQPAVGEPIPWLACLDGEDTKPLDRDPATWTWRVAWPKDVPQMRIGQTLTTAADDLPEVWGANSVAVLYPDTTKDKSTVLLADPTVAQTYDLPYTVLTAMGLKTGGNEALTLMKGRYYFNGLPPSLSDRIYLDPTLGQGGKLVLIGKQEDNTGGVSLLHFNVLNTAERAALLAVADAADKTQDAYKTFAAAVAAIGTVPVEPTSAAYAVGQDVRIAYTPVDHYALTAMGGTNYVTIIENDATNTAMVAAADPISMHVFRVIPEYYTGRIVTREDAVNLLSQQLDVLYAESFAGRAGEYVFEWRKAAPRSDGTVPDDYAGEYALKFPLADSAGLTRFTIGAQGDTLANMVNTYYIMRYRARDMKSAAYAAMGTNWSAWCAPPALAEGWVQRVLNNITPFTQRMTDLYENAAETAISMIQQAGPPYEGDVALNQDNLTSVGLIQLYQTILNKAESMSLLLGLNDESANKQLLLAAERLADLYTVLGDEAYADALNPTISFGSNFGEVEDGLGIDYGAASTALFCFDNQVSSLLEEELALLRGRSGANAPVTTISPYYNRLVWNFTRGITAGEVAYAVNYNITGTQSSSIDYQQAAALYPQGHGDAYGHYLSALMGYYRLLRNPYFSWGVPGMSEMMVADTVVNVDYYDESKFAAAAANLAKVAADVVDRTARKAWKDGAQTTSGGGYLDEDTSRGFGYGEWATRGGYGGLCNWVVANSLLPARQSVLNEMGSAFTDEGLTLIDRTTVDELADIAAQVKAIQTKVDTLDRGANPLGLVDGAIPFDITPLGATDGSATHYEQIRARAQKALVNAQKTLDHAQTYANRLRMIEEAAAGYADNLDALEQDYNSQLIAIYGYPYSDDIGPSGTYVQGYDGPDLYHYMWMDYAQYGLVDMLNLDPVTNYLVNVDGSLTPSGVVSFAFSANGLVQKPATITGTRRAQGEIQQAYADFIMAYADTLRAVNNYSDALDYLARSIDQCQTAKGRAAGHLANVTTITAGRETCFAILTAMGVGMNTIDFASESLDETTQSIYAAIPSISGAGLTVNIDPRALASAAIGLSAEAAQTSWRISKYVMQQTSTIAEQTSEELELLGEYIDAALDYADAVDEADDALEDAANATQDAIDALMVAWATMINAQEAYNTVIAKGERLQEERELARQQAVNNITKLKYNDMFFRKLRNEALTRYSTSFDLAQRYAFLSAKAYDFETGLLSADATSGAAFLGEIIAARALGEIADDGTPLTGTTGDPGLADILARLDANWDVLKPRLGINNPQSYATWFSLRRECFRILPSAEGDAAWRTELSKYKVDDLLTLPAYRRYCQPLQCVNGLQAKEPGFVIPFATTVDFAKNFFGHDLAAGDSTFDATYFATKIAAAGVWFEGYNANTEIFAKTPNVYLIPAGTDCLRAPGQTDGSYLCYNVVDQTIPLPYDIGSTELNSTDWTPLYDGYTDGVDLGTRIRRHPSFRAYYGDAPSDTNLDCTRLVGRSVWNTQWLLIIPAGALRADRDAALAAFLNGEDTNRDGVKESDGVTDIRIGFKSYANSGN